MLWFWVLIGIAAYFFLVFVVSPFIIPFLRRESLPSRIPKEMQEAIHLVEKDAKSPFEYVKACAEYILSTNHCGRLATVRRLDLAFQRDLRTLWKRPGFMHCTHLNHLMRVMLAFSKFFTDDDIQLRRTFVNFNIHQYVQVKIAGQWYDVDLGGDWMGVPLGKHVWGFR